MNTEEVKSNIQLRKVCEDLVAFYQRTIDGGSVTVAEWQAIENRAWEEAWAGAKAGGGVEVGVGVGEGRGVDVGGDEDNR